MLPKNPFNSSYTEMIDSNETFLSLFDATILDHDYNDNGDKFVDEEMFGKIVFFSSALGGGKSSLFHFFSPSVLDTIVQSKESFAENYRYLKQIGVINDNKVNLLSVYISCARNYEIIDDIFENGKKSLTFFALLNVRVLKEALKSILVLKRVNADSLKFITFSSIPTELNSVFQLRWNGKDYYEWACEEEKRICQALNDLDDDMKFNSIHSYLSVVQLFEPDNIYYNGEKIVGKVLFLFDDVHRLTQFQKDNLRKSLFIVRAKVGVWLAQRTYGLDDMEILGIDGTYGREFISRRLENVSKKRSSLDSILKKIADKRAKAAQSVNVSSFQACIDNELNWEQDENIKQLLETAYFQVEEALKPFFAVSDIEHFKNSRHDLLQKVIYLRIIKILIDRAANKPQMVLDFFFLAPSEEEIVKATSDSDLNHRALYYISIENSLPFYYGLEKLFLLSSNNVYQFLTFAGAVFERRLSYQYSPKKGNDKVSSLEQDKIIHTIAERKWNELRTSFVDAEKIENALINISHIGIKARLSGTASYGGGAYTGIGIRQEEFEYLIQKDAKLRSLLSICVSNNLLSKHSIKQGNKNEIYIVFYLNRWVCVYFNLPLAYGGWKSCNKVLFRQCFLKNSQKFAEDYDGGKKA